MTGFPTDPILTLEPLIEAIQEGVLAAGWELSFSGLDGVAGSAITIVGASIDTSFQFAEIEVALDLAQCSSDPTCEAVLQTHQDDSKAAAIPAVQSLTTTANGVVLVFDQVDAGPFPFFGAPWFDIVLETAVVPSLSPLAIVTLCGLFGLAGYLRLRR